MPRFLTALLAVFFLVLVSTAASAQDLPMPGRGEILELRRDDPRSTEGYRSFIFGSWTSGMGGLGDILDRVNADLEGESRVTWEQLDAANPCIIIYRRDGHRFGHNGTCDTNSTDERVTYASYCEGDSSCARWPMANRVYRVPARPRLTPGERAEEMVRTLDGTTVTETVPAPAELGGWLTELSDAMGEEQPPTNDQVRNVIGAVGRALTRAESASAGTDAHAAPEPAAIADTHPDMVFHEDDVPGTSEDEAALRPTSAEDGAHTSSTSTGAATSWSTNPIFLWLIIATLSLAVILLLFKDKIRAWYRPTLSDNDHELPETEPTPPRPTEDEVRGKKIWNSLQVLWKQFYKKLGRNDQLTEESLVLFFDAADTNRMLAEKYEKDLKTKEAEIERLKNAPAKIEYREDTKRVSALESQLAKANADKTAAEAIKSDLEARAMQIGFAHAATLRAKDESIAELTEKSKKAERELETYKERANELVTKFQQEGLASLQLALELALKTGDDSQPSLMKALEYVDHAKRRFEEMVQGVYNELLLHIAPELALVPASPDVMSRSFAAALSAPSIEGSWTGPLDESVPDLATERTSHGEMIPGFGGFPELSTAGDETHSVPPSSAESLPPVESLKGESTNPGFAPPAPMPAPAVTEQDNEAYRVSKHPLPNVPPAKSKREQRRERRRKTTESFDRVPVQQAIEEKQTRDRDDEKTGVFDPARLAEKRLEARTGKTITPGMTAASRDDSPIPGSLVPPPPPSVPLATEHGNEPDPNSIFNDGSSEETGVIKRAGSS